MKRRQAEQSMASKQTAVEATYQEPNKEPLTMNSTRFRIGVEGGALGCFIVRPITSKTTGVSRVKYFPDPPSVYFVRYNGEDANHRHNFFPPDLINLPADLTDRRQEIMGELEEINSLIMEYEREVGD